MKTHLVGLIATAMLVFGLAQAQAGPGGPGGPGGPQGGRPSYGHGPSYHHRGGPPPGRPYSRGGVSVNYYGGYPAYYGPVAYPVYYGPPAYPVAPVVYPAYPCGTTLSVGPSGTFFGISF